MNRFLTTLTALFLISLNIFPQWEQTSTGMNGGSVLALLVNDSVIFAACDQINSNGAGNVYKTTNNGEIWVSSNVSETRIKCLGAKYNKIFAGTDYNGLFESTDNGIHWNQNSLDSVSVWSIEILGNRIIAGCGNGVYISDNNGSSWTFLNSFLARVLKASGNVLFAGSNQGVYSSVDTGVTWSQILNINLPVEALDINTNFIFAGSYAGLYRSTNFGINWLLAGFGTTMIPAVKISGNFVFTSSLGALWYSTNFGSSFIRSNTIAGSAYSFAIKGGNIYAGITGSVGVLRSSNNGANWLQTELHNVRVLSLYDTGNEMYAGVVNKGIYHSSNNGLNWTHKSFQYEDISDFLSNENRIFAATLNDGLYYSSNNGMNWIHSNLSANEVYFIDKYGNELYAGTESSGLFRSTNNGNNWQRIVPILNTVRALSVHNGIMFISVENQNPGYIGVKFSTNMGRSWLNSVFGGQRVLTLLSSNNVLFAGTESGGIFKTTDNGLSWISLEIGSTDVNCILDINNYLICGTGRGVYYSSNSGNSWIYLNNGLDSQRVYSLMVSGNYLYAGTEANAVWRLDVSQIIGINPVNTEIPKSFKLHQNFPNPFNPETKISFDIPASSSGAGNVVLLIYDSKGKLIQKVVDQRMSPGTYSVSFDGSNFASGVYFYSLVSGDFKDSKKMILIK